VSDYLRRANPPFTKKVPLTVEPVEATTDWKLKAVKFIDRVRRVPYRKRVYEDESPVYANELKSFARARRGKRAKVPQHYRAKRYTLHVYASQNCVVHWALRDANANDSEVKEQALAAVEKMKEGDVLIWDRLGKSGRKAKPDKQHYNPAVLAALADKGCDVLYLPPMGKYLNPDELLFNDLKQHYIRPAKNVHGQNFTKAKLLSIINSYMRNVAPTVLPAFFAKRGNGADVPS
jgi:hypothetical protein